MSRSIANCICSITIVLTMLTISCHCKVIRRKREIDLDTKFRTAPRYVPGLKCWECGGDGTDGKGPMGPICEDDHSQGKLVDCPPASIPKSDEAKWDFPYSVHYPAVPTPDPNPPDPLAPSTPPPPFVFNDQLISYWRCAIHKTISHYGKGHADGKIEISKGCETLAINRHRDWNQTILNGSGIGCFPYKNDVRNQRHYTHSICFCSTTNCNKDEINGIGKEDIIQRKLMKENATADSSAHSIFLPISPQNIFPVTDWQTWNLGRFFWNWSLRWWLGWTILFLLGFRFM